MWRRPRLYMLVLYFSSLTGRLGFHFLFTEMTILAGNIIYSALVVKSSNDGNRRSPLRLQSASPNGTIIIIIMPVKLK